MKKVIKYLNGMKSRCFILLTCLILLVSATSCSNDNFETNLPDEPKQLSKSELLQKYSKAELIEQALSRMPKTRAVEPYPVMMVTTKKTVSIICYANESVIIHWNSIDETLVEREDGNVKTYTYSDDEPVHGIWLEASSAAIMNLDVYSDGLIFLDVVNNINLTNLSCSYNSLDSLNLDGCYSLRELYADFNPLSSLDLTHLSELRTLFVRATQLTDIDVSNNPELEELFVGYNQITDLDLTNNTALKNIGIDALPLRTINNIPINAKSFAAFPKLEMINMHNTSFLDSLDLLDNPLVRYIDISWSTITQMNISNLQIDYLDARFSQLINLKYTLDNLKPDCYYINIIETPFEKNRTNVYFLASSIPDRTRPNRFGSIQQGQLYTTSETIKDFLDPLTGKNWVVYSE